MIDERDASWDAVFTLTEGWLAVPDDIPTVTALVQRGQERGQLRVHTQPQHPGVTFLHFAAAPSQMDVETKLTFYDIVLALQDAGESQIRLAKPLRGQGPSLN